MSLRGDGTDPVQTGLLRFDLAGRLPAGATVRFAVLSVRVTYVPNAAGSPRGRPDHRPWKRDRCDLEPGRRSNAVDGRGRKRAFRPTGPASPRTAARSIRLSRLDHGRDRSDWYGFDVTGIVAGLGGESRRPIGAWRCASTPQEGARWRRLGLAKDGFSIASSDYLIEQRWRPQLFIVYTQDPLTPTPSNTPTATATPTLTPTATNTPTATATPPDGSITGLVFVDSNRNGVHEAGEAGVAGRLVQLKRNGAVANNVTSDSNGGYVFDRVPPGAWEVDVSAPANYQVTTASGNPAEAAVSAGHRDGSRFRAGVSALRRRLRRRSRPPQRAYRALPATSTPISQCS